MVRRQSAGPTGMDAVAAFADRLSEASREPNINRFEPMPMQELFLKSQKKNRIAFGGNQAGKTHIGVADDILILRKAHPHRSHLYPSVGPIRMRCIGVDFERGIDQVLIPKFQTLLPPSMLIDGSWERSYSKGDHILTLADKSTVSFMSYEQHPNKFQGVTLHHIHFDEEPPKAVWDESMPRLVKFGGTWTLTETPVQQLEWVQDDLMDKAGPGGEREADIDIVTLDTRDNIHLSSEALTDLIANMSVEDQVIRLAGGYKTGNFVFPEFTRRYPHVIPDEAFTLTEEWAVFATMDHGYANPTAWLWVAVHPDGSIVVFRCLYAASVTVSEWAKLIKAVNAEIGALLDVEDWRPVAYVGDPAITHRNNAESGNTVQQLYAMEGIAIGTEGIVATRSGNQNAGLDKIHTYLRPRLQHLASASTGELGEPWMQILESCTALIDEMKRAKRPKQSLNAKMEKNPSEDIRDKDNHAIDALKYLFMVTGDLRPVRHRTEAGFEYELPEEWAEVVGDPSRTHAAVAHATMAKHSQWRISGAGNYRELEG